MSKVYRFITHLSLSQIAQSIKEKKIDQHNISQAWNKYTLNYPTVVLEEGAIQVSFVGGRNIATTFLGSFSKNEDGTLTLIGTFTQTSGFARGVAILIGGIFFLAGLGLAISGEMLGLVFIVMSIMTTAGLLSQAQGADTFVLEYLKMLLNTDSYDTTQ